MHLSFFRPLSFQVYQVVACSLNTLLKSQSIFVVLPEMALHELESVPEGHCSSTAFWFCIFPFDQSSKVSFHPSLPNPVTPAPASPCVGGTLQELTHFCEANDTAPGISPAPKGRLVGATGTTLGTPRRHWR